MLSSLQIRAQYHSTMHSIMHLFSLLRACNTGTAPTRACLPLCWGSAMSSVSHLPAAVHPGKGRRRLCPTASVHAPTPLASGSTLVYDSYIGIALLLALATFSHLILTRVLGGEDRCPRFTNEVIKTEKLRE